VYYKLTINLFTTDDLHRELGESKKDIYHLFHQKLQGGAECHWLMPILATQEAEIRRI
jgi:hypothetical protein